MEKVGRNFVHLEASFPRETRFGKILRDTFESDYFGNWSGEDNSEEIMDKQVNGVE